MKDLKVKKAFEEIFGGDYRFFAAPGRINLIGEHTDYNEGFVLPAAIDKNIYLAIAPLKGPLAKITALDLNESVDIAIYEQKVKIPQWAKYPYGVVKEMQARGYFLEGFQAVFAGDIPKGAGLSSSAALESAFAQALNQLYKLGMDKMTLAKVGQGAEHNYAGVHCGIMDQFASFFGKKGHVMQLDCRSLDYKYYPLPMDGYELWLTDTRVKHSLASSAYNQRREQCEEGVRILAQNMPDVKSLRDVKPGEILANKEHMGEEVFMRCEYVTEENQRVLETCQALEKGDMKKTGELMFASHQGLRHKYHVSCDELDLLADTARQTEGVMGARMMGGGFGGCTINLVQTGAVDAFKEESSNAFEKAFGKPPVFYNVTISDGVKEIKE